MEGGELRLESTQRGARLVRCAGLGEARRQTDEQHVIGVLVGLGWVRALGFRGRGYIDSPENKDPRLTPIGRAS